MSPEVERERYAVLYVDDEKNNLLVFSAVFGEEFQVHTAATAFLGLAIMPEDPAAASGIAAGSGAVVSGVVPGSPADGAGLAAGDVITSAGGHPISSPSGLQVALGQHHPGDSVTIGWTDQAGLTHSAALVLASGPAA